MTQTFRKNFTFPRDSARRASVEFQEALNYLTRVLRQYMQFGLCSDPILSDVNVVPGRVYKDYQITGIEMLSLSDIYDTNLQEDAVIIRVHFEPVYEFNRHD